MNLKVIDFSNNSISDFSYYGDIKCVKIEHSNQISTSIDWLKGAVGYGIGTKSTFKYQNNFLGVHAGFGIGSAYFDDKIENFRNKSFHGFTPNIGLLFNYTNDYFRLTSNNEIKAVVFDKALYVAEPKIDIFVNISKFNESNLDSYYDSYLILNIGYSFSKVFYKSNFNKSNSFHIGLFKSLG